ncbi:MAG: DUF3859 domain-containing protein [Blastocatellia bacterium]
MQTQERIRNEQVSQVVAEVTRLAQQREDLEMSTLERSQVEQLLAELNLPPDLIDDALAQLRRKEALAKEQKRRKLIIGGSALVVLLLLSGIWWSWSARSAAFARVTADIPRITRAMDDGGTLHLLTRDGQDTAYHAILRDVPQGERLNLRCNWIDPNGAVFRQNTWTTSAVDKAAWPTSCKCQLGPAAPQGLWKVEMTLDGRTLSSTSFQVE